MRGGIVAIPPLSLSHTEGTEVTEELNAATAPLWFLRSLCVIPFFFPAGSALQAGGAGVGAEVGALHLLRLRDEVALHRASVVRRLVGGALERFQRQVLDVELQLGHGDSPVGDGTRGEICRVRRICSGGGRDARRRAIRANADAERSAAGGVRNVRGDRVTLRHPTIWAPPTREGCTPGGPGHRRGASMVRKRIEAGAAGARRGWQQSYRCLPRAQPGPERSGGTRPNRAVHHRLETTRVADRRRGGGDGGQGPRQGAEERRGVEGAAHPRTVRGDAQAGHRARLYR